MTDATLFDGSTAESRAVAVTAEGGAVRISHGDGSIELVDPALLSQVEGSDGRRFSRSDVPGWRLRLQEAPDADLAALLPCGIRGYGRWIDRIGLAPAAIAFAAVAGVVLLAGHLAPAWIAPYVPESWERNLGTALVGDFGDRRCADPAGNRALNALAERIEPGVTTRGDAHRIRFTAIDPHIFNAAALPGGQIIVFRDMIADTNSDALAGVLAHEIAHVRRRHVTQALIRELGVGALIRLFAGGIGANAEQLVALSYTRANEAEADSDSIRMLAAAHIDPRPTAKLFERLAKETGESEKPSGLDTQFLQSHPVSRDRAKRFAASYRPGATYRAALSPEQTEALADICWKQPKQGEPPRVTLVVKRP